LSREEIASVAMTKKNSAVKGTVIGVAVGGGAGAGIGAAVIGLGSCRQGSNCSFSPNGRDRALAAGSAYPDRLHGETLWSNHGPATADFLFPEGAEATFKFPS
jgi:hypothetical protein